MNLSHPRNLHSFVDLFFNLPINKPFTYLIPHYLKGKIFPGQRVLAPFGKKQTGKKQKIVTGITYSVHNQTPKFPCKPIQELCDPQPILNRQNFQLATWISNYYASSFPQALFLSVPKEFKPKIPPTPNVPHSQLLPLNPQQNHSFLSISSILSSQKPTFSSFLIFGATGTGKTEIYKHLAQSVVQKKKQTLILIPEISLSPQTTTQFQSYFGKKIAVIHSHLSPKERFFHWQKIQQGKVNIILGTRSAVFAPFSKLGLIIVDEEHDSSYKSSDTPRYHARQVAFKIAQILQIPIVLASATPSVESFAYHQNIQNSTFFLSKRHSSFQKPIVTVVNMQNQSNPISPILQQKILQCLQKKQQIILFLNRRGHSPILLCQTCHSILKCNACDISLTYHSSNQSMLCHYCSFSQKPPSHCPSCSTPQKISFVGSGIQKIQEILQKLFPQSSISRLDTDSTSKKNTHASILSQFQNRKIDILVGTQMISKGLHFPNVTLVGVILADVGLHFPDFRATEKTAALLTQISGRSGRGNIQGEVLIQTYLPNHYVVQSVENQNYHSFLLKELQERKKLNYPPFSRLVKLLLRSSDHSLLFQIGQKLASFLSSFLPPKKNQQTQILGPAPAPISKIKHYYRLQIILKNHSIKPLQKLALHAKQFIDSQKLSYKKVYLEIDVDPVSML